MVRFDDLRLFVRTAELGSISAAARELDVSPALASAALKRLEAELGTALLLRSTRSLRLTTPGERYLDHARAALAALQAGADVISQQKQSISGKLSIAIPADLGRNVLIHWLDEFQARYPALQLQLRISDRQADLYRQPVDVAIRYGAPEDSSMVALPLVPNNARVLCAAPLWLARNPAPQTPADLGQHNCLRFMLGDQVHDRWTFVLGAQTEIVAVNGDRITDDAELVRRWALSGLGIAYKSRLDLLGDLRAGNLVPLLPAWRTEPTPLYLLCGHRLMLTPAVVKLREMLQARLAAYG